MRQVILSLLLLFLLSDLSAQQPGKKSIRISVMNDQKNALSGSTVYLLGSDSAVIRSGSANTMGIIEFLDLPAGKYKIRATNTGFEDGYSSWIDLEKNNSYADVLLLKSKSGVLKDVTVT